MVLGNFKSNANTHTSVINPTHLPTLSNDVYIDDVSLVEMELPAFAGNDTSIWFGDSVFIGREPDVGIDYACQWFLLPNDSVPIDTIAGLWVKPNAPSTYVVRQQLWCSGVKWDTVSIHFLTVGVNQNLSGRFELYPNPSQGNFVIKSRVADDVFSVTVTDITGKVLYEKNEISQNPSLQIELACPEGLYFVKITTAQGMITRKIILQRDPAGD